MTEIPTSRTREKLGSTAVQHTNTKINKIIKKYIHIPNTCFKGKNSKNRKPKFYKHFSKNNNRIIARVKIQSAFLMEYLAIFLYFLYNERKNIPIFLASTYYVP